MITFEEAQRLLRKYVKPGRVVERQLLESLGLVLARPVVSRTDSPRFDVSAVDGYAVSLSDFDRGAPVTLPIVATIHAGAGSLRLLKKGTVQRIFTGAPVPKGTDAIVMQEYVTRFNDSVSFTATPKAGAYIRKRGAELRRGELLFERGATIMPSVAQTLAACGYDKVRVHDRPVVSIVITGDELRTPGVKLKHGEIWDSNTIGLRTALSAVGITNIHTLNISDNPRSTAKAIRSALARSDVVIATGGVSVGDRDYVKEAFASNGVREIFWGVSMKPGKPFFFGVKPQASKPKYVFGLPGNPVSVMVTYQLFVRRAILRMMGHADEGVTQRGILTLPIKKSDPRTEFVRAYHDGTRDRMPNIVPLTARDSHMTTGMAKTDCLIVFPLEEESIEAGREVEIISIRWAAY